MRVLMLFLVLAVGCQQSKTTPAGKPLYTREEFRTLVIGKTGEEVIAAIGRPDSATDNEDGSPQTWTYWSRVMNPTTQKPETAFIRFEKGKAARVDW